MHLPDISILGLGYLGLPLAQKFYEHGSQVAAVKRNLTSDDINLPIELDIIDLNQDDIFHSSTLWQNHINKPTWFCLLPPSSLNHYADTLKKWIQLAEQSKIQHIIFTSSTSVYGDQARICDETTPPDPQTESAYQILAVEQALLESAVPHIDILRLGGLYSADRHPVTKLVQKTRIQGGNQPVNILHKDLGVQVLFQTACQADGKRIRNIVEPRHLSRAKFYTAEAAKLGLPAPDFIVDDKSNGKIVNTVCADGLSL